MIRVFVAGALSSKEAEDRTPSRVVVDYIHNIHKMCETATYLMHMGYAPFIPAADILVGMISGTWNEEDYRDVSMEFLTACDCVYVSSMSWGVEQEISVAKERGIPVFFKIEEMEKWRQELT